MISYTLCNKINVENKYCNIRFVVCYNQAAKSPYKPRPHKGGKNSGFSGEQTVVYAKKSTVPQAQQQQTTGQQSQIQVRKRKNYSSEIFIIIT